VAIVLATLAAALALIAVPSQDATEPTTRRPPVVSTGDAPAGTETLAVEWVQIAAPGLGVMRAAVARPAGPGAFPVVVLLHGTHGFARQYVQLAQGLARGGVLAIAPCWFAGRSGPGTRFVTGIDCPEAPKMPGASSAEARRIVEALVQAARSLPGARPDRVALFGHSRGGGATLHYILAKNDVQAAVVNSAGYSDELTRPRLEGAGSAADPARHGRRSCGRRLDLHGRQHGAPLRDRTAAGRPAGRRALLRRRRPQRHLRECHTERRSHTADSRVPMAAFSKLTPRPISWRSPLARALSRERTQSEQVERWLAGATTNPNEASKKAKLKMILVQG